MDEVRARAEAAANAGSAAAALALVTAAAEDVEQTHPAQAAVLLADAAWYARGAHGPERALELARRAAGLATDGDGDVALVVRARLGDALQWSGRYGEAREEWLLAASADASPRPRMLCVRADALLRAGELVRARETAYAAAARADAADDGAALYDALTFQALSEIHLGLLREAHGSATRLSAFVRADADVLGLLAWIEALLGDEASVRARIDAAREQAETLGYTLSNGMAAGFLELARGHYAEAADQLEAKLKGGSPTSAALSLRPFLDALVEACMRAGRRERAAQLCDEVFAAALATAQPRYVAVAYRMRGVTHGELAAFEAAVEEHSRWGNRFEEARTRLLYGEALRRARQKGRAREQLSAAATAFDALGTRLWQRRAEEELRAAGARIRRMPSETPLTPQEERIAQLVAEGLSNKEIASRLVLSTKTVEGHLRNVFAKLGATSRTQVARKLLGS